MTEATRDLMSAWKDFRIEVEEYRELDDKRILAVWDFKGRGKASGVEAPLMQATGAYLFEIGGGRVTSLAYYVNRKLALADLGLTE